MHWAIPLFHHDGQGYDHYVLQNVAGRGVIIMVYIMMPAGYDHFVLHNDVAAVTSSNGCLA